MKNIWRILRCIIVITNILFAVAMLLSAYSPCFEPEKHAYFSSLGILFPFFLFINIFYFIFWLVFYRKFLWISLITGLLCFTQIYTLCPIHFSRKEKPQIGLKFISYNIMGVNSNKKYAPNAKEIFQYINESDADIVCIQELTLSKTNPQYSEKNTITLLDKYPYYTHLKFREKALNGVACFSKLPILSSEVIAYKSQFNGGIMINIQWGEDTLTVLNNHLESNGITKEDRVLYKDIIVHQHAQELPTGGLKLWKKIAEATIIRGKQARFAQNIVDSLLQKQRKVIVCGDFNATPISYTLKTLTERLENAFVKSGIGLGVSYNKGGFYFRIDHILYSDNLESYQCEVDNRIKASDHYPISCYFKKGNNH